MTTTDYKSNQATKATRSDGITIMVDLSKCISAGPCTIAAPNTFFLRESDGKAVIINPEGDSLEKIKEATRSCPVSAIILKNKLGKQIYP